MTWAIWKRAADRPRSWINRPPDLNGRERPANALTTAIVASIGPSSSGPFFHSPRLGEPTASLARLQAARRAPPALPCVCRGRSRQADKPTRTERADLQTSKLAHSPR